MLSHVMCLLYGPDVKQGHLFFRAQYARRQIAGLVLCSLGEHLPYKQTKESGLRRSPGTSSLPKRFSRPARVRAMTGW